MPERGIEARLVLVLNCRVEISSGNVAKSEVIEVEGVVCIGNYIVVVILLNYAENLKKTFGVTRREVLYTQFLTYKHCGGQETYT